MIGLLLFAHLMHSAACVPSGNGYLPTPSPCVAIVGGEIVQMRMLADPKPVKPGGMFLREFKPNPRSKLRWLLLAVLL